MPLIEAALAFAITMLALSLIVSSFVEIIHRTLGMREAGLKYMLERLFDQVLRKYAEPLADKIAKDATKARDDAALALKVALSKTPVDENKKKVLERNLAAATTALAGSLEGAYKTFRKDFIKHMTANRAPVGLKADAKLADLERANAPKPWRRIWLSLLSWLDPGWIWGGRRVTALAPADFMERLGSHWVGEEIKNKVSKSRADFVADAVQNATSIDLAREIKKLIDRGTSAPDAAAAVWKDITDKLDKIDVRKAINDAATSGGKVAADNLDTALTDIAQKFDGYGKDAAAYFEGRARFMSVLVAIVLAFAVHADAIDLFKTYFRDPNARAAVIEQSKTITAQYEAAKKNIESLGELEKAKDKEAAEKLAEAQKQGGTPAAVDPAAAAAKGAEEANNAAKSAADAKAQVEKLRKDTLDAIDKTNETVKSFAGLGAPLGWTDERWKNARMLALVWSCTKLEAGATWDWWNLWRICKLAEAPNADDKGSQSQGGTGQPQGAQNQTAPPKAPVPEEGKDYKVWVGIPREASVILYLLLGGLLIGLGSPFWYDVVTGLTNIRSTVSGAGSSAPAKPAPAAPPQPADADKAQPATPAGAFKVSSAAK